MSMHNVRAFGRDFHTSEDGFLLDQDGAPTRFRTMDLEIRHAAQPPYAFHGEIQPGDSVAYADPVTVQGREQHRWHLLVRDGRMVKCVDGIETVIFD